MKRLNTYNLEIETENDLLKLSFPCKIHFSETNNIRYFQDFTFWEHIPHNILFDAEIFDNKKIVLTADGYGNLKKENCYGNGQIFLTRPDRPKFDNCFIL